MNEAERLADLLERDPSEWGGLSLGWKAAAELRRLSAELEEARKDAERYRWLRSNGTGHCTVSGLFERVGDSGQISLKCTSDLDKAIDATTQKGHS